MLISRRGRWIGECCDGIGWDDRLLAATTPTPIGRALQSDIIPITLHLLLLQGSSQLPPAHAASVVILCSVSGTQRAHSPANT